MPVTVIVSPRQKEIYEQYLQQLDAHMQDLKEGKAERVLEIRELAALLHIHPVHLSNTIKEVSGKSTCSFYEERLLELVKGGDLFHINKISVGKVDNPIKTETNLLFLLPLLM